MALKALMLRKKITDATKILETLRSKDAEFEKREAELETAITEAETDEEKKTVEEEVEKFEAERTEHNEEKSKLEKEVEGLEKDLAEEEERTKVAPVQQPAVSQTEERKVEAVMHTRKFEDMTIEQRNRLVAEPTVKDFLEQVRTCIKEKRALSNVGIAIPETFLPLLKTKVEETSKLIGIVNLVQVAGTARQRIMGTIPEAVWTEMCASLNELSLGFNETDVDGYKVGGFFAVCNAVLEDNDVNLAGEIINALGKSIGKALDRAIIYGKGAKMPLGIVTRLAQESKPSDYNDLDRTWADLHTSNIITGTGATGLNLFKEIAQKKKVIKNDYISENLVWIMSENTHLDLMTNSMDKNLNAALVAGISDKMPVVGGDIIELNIIPDGDIVFGYAGAYLLAERAGTQLSQSEHVRFIEDQTVFKGTARYDGKPVIAEAFGVYNINGTAPTTTNTFPADKANTAE